MENKPFASEPDLTEALPPDEGTPSLSRVARWAQAWSEDLRREAKELSSSHSTFIEPPLYTPEPTVASTEIEPLNV